MAILTQGQRDEFRNSIKSQSHMRFIIHPNSENANALFEKSELRNILFKARVTRGSDTFPRIAWSQDQLKLADNYVEGYYDGRAKSAYRLYTSGQFVYQATLEEDEPEMQKILKDALELVDEEAKSEIQNYLNYLWNIHRIAEYYSFAGRLSLLTSGVDEWQVQISFKNPGIRALSMNDISRAGFWNPYIIEDDIDFDQVLGANELRLEPNSACLKCLQFFNSKFGFEAREDLMKELMVRAMK